MKFLANENIAPRVVEALRKAKFIVRTIQEQGFVSAPDGKVISFALRNNYVIITHDKDFGNLLHYALRSHAGVILLRLKNQSPGNVIRHLIPFLKKISLEKLKNRLTIFRENRVKIV